LISYPVSVTGDALAVKEAVTNLVALAANIPRKLGLPAACYATRAPLRRADRIPSRLESAGCVQGKTCQILKAKGAARFEEMLAL